MSTLRSGATGHPRVVVIGGGATGTGIARDAAAHGFKVTLIERGKLGGGTSGHFHGILHSGARYVVNEPSVATECFEENRRLRHIVPSAVTNTGGMFLALDAKEAAHADTIMHACLKAGIPTREISVEQALKSEPHVTHGLKRAFLVPDAFINGAELIRLNRAAAVKAATPATFIQHHAVEELRREGSKITSVMIKDTRTGTMRRIECDYVINAAGVWSGQVAQLASVPLHMIFDKGTMIAFKHRFSTAVLNRSRPEDDADLLAPDAAGRSVLGTTARVIADPDDCYPTQEEVDVLMREGVAMIPQLQQAEAVKVYAGVRPLFDTGGLHVDGTTRSVSRSYRVLDHEEQGVANFISVVGGKVTLYRRMAEDAVKLLRTKSGQSPTAIKVS